jgi:TldD protein
MVLNSAGFASLHRARWVSIDLAARAAGRRAAAGAWLPVGGPLGTVVGTAENLLREVTSDRGDPPAAGRFDVVCDPEFSGLLAHELVGHALEGDLHGRASPLPLRSRVAADVVSVTDDPGSLVPGASYPFDDEGVPARRTPLIVNGQVAGLVHSLETAAAAGAEPTGHGRAVDWRHDPIPRLSTTSFEAQDGSAEELVDEVRDGLFLCGARGGHGGNRAALVARESRLIRAGRLGPYLGPALVYGTPSQLLRKISRVGAPACTFSGGEGGCGKQGQFPLPVAAGGPSLLLRGCPVVVL